MSEKNLHPLAKRNAQESLLKAIEDHCPEVLKSLAGNLLDSCRQLNLPDPRIPLGKVDHRLLLAMFHAGKQPYFTHKSASDSEKYAEPVRAALESLLGWAAAYGLRNVHWFVADAGQTLQWWVHCERSSDEEEKSAVGHRWFYDLRYYEAAQYPPLRVEVQPFNPIIDSKTEYREKAIAGFNAFVDEYLKDKLEHWKHGKREEAHFTWLALRLCRKESINGLHKLFERPRSAIREGIQTAAGLLDIELPKKDD